MVGHYTRTKVNLYYNLVQVLIPESATGIGLKADRVRDRSGQVEVRSGENRAYNCEKAEKVVRGRSEAGREWRRHSRPVVSVSTHGEPHSQPRQTD